jgi:hypothetical protein
MRNGGSIEAWKQDHPVFVPAKIFDRNSQLRSHKRMREAALARNKNARGRASGVG